MTDNKKDPWEGFLTKNTDPVDTRELYEAYKVFKRRVESLPKSELLRLGWISDKEDLSSMTDFFKDIYSERNNALFRKSNASDAALLSVWLSKVRSTAEVNVISDSVPSFNGLSKQQLKDIARMSIDTDIIRALPSIMAQYGIVLVYERSLSATKVDGVVFRLSSGHPVIGLSFRYSRIDYFWFTLLHELAHICLHIDKISNPILDDLDVSTQDEIELAANRLAKYSFVDRSAWRSCEPKYNKNYKAVEKFAEETGIHKGIVAGLLRKELGDYSLYSKMVNEINVRELVFGNG